jgi:GH15 family glucan-1,4-alpha-glucosidase
VRIGNGAADHLQLDIYGELMDCIYLAQKYSKPLHWDSWVAVRQVVDYVCTMVGEKDLSIWCVRTRARKTLADTAGSPVGRTNTTSTQKS